MNVQLGGSLENVADVRAAIHLHPSARMRRRLAQRSIHRPNALQPERGFAVFDRTLIVMVTRRPLLLAEVPFLSEQTSRFAVG
jgi:hypothetical protein